MSGACFKDFFIQKFIYDYIFLMIAATGIRVNLSIMEKAND